MEFRIADTFTDSLARLSGDEQKAVKTTAFDLQLKPANPGMKLHKLDRAKDPKFWSVRVSGDVRLILHRTNTSMLLCFVGHHDEAYAWAERRKLERHPKTGAAQLVEIRETVRKIEIPTYLHTEVPGPAPGALLGHVSDENLLSYGVPEEWLDDVRVATEDTLLELTDHLPAEASEALLDLAVGQTPVIPVQIEQDEDAFDHPDAQRRFRVMANAEELERALDYPWEKWAIYLHPDQQDTVDREFNGPARVSGSAGTGKTVVALHRAAHLARSNPDARVLLATFSKPLANALKTKLRRLLAHEPRLCERVEVYDMGALARRLYQLNIGDLELAPKDRVVEFLIEAAAAECEEKFSTHFLVTEWEQVVDAWQIKTWENYRDVVRLGRKTRLPEGRRAVLWAIYKRVRAELKEQDLLTQPDMYSRLADNMNSAQTRPFDFAVVDEAQDVSVSQLRFLAALAGDKPNGLFFAGDLGQRIFQQPFSWKQLGVDIRGRSRNLRVNYRTSHQIRSQADRLLAPELADLDGNVEERRSTISVFNGPAPTILIPKSPGDETKEVAQWLRNRIADGVLSHEIGVFVRSDDQVPRGFDAVHQAGLSQKTLDDTIDTKTDHVSIGTMHRAKGLEFKAVVVMACDDEVIPLQSRIESVTDESDLEEVYNTERHLLYVACTRARDHLLVSGVEPASEFLDDVMAGG